MIVFGYDGSLDAQRAITAAAGLVRGPAVVAHVWEPVPGGAATAVASPGIAGAGMSRLAGAEHDIEAEARAVVEDGTRRAAGAGFEAEAVLIRGRGGGPWRDLVDLAEQRDASVIVVGRRGISRLQSVLLGSVSEGAVKHAHVPVLVVPPSA